MDVCVGRAGRVGGAYGRRSRSLTGGVHVLPLSIFLAALSLPPLMAAAAASGMLCRATFIRFQTNARRLPLCRGEGGGLGGGGTGTGGQAAVWAERRGSTSKKAHAEIHGNPAGMVAQCGVVMWAWWHSVVL